MNNLINKLFAGPAEIIRPRVLLILTTFALVSIGIVMVYSASFVQAISYEVEGTYYLVRQLLFVAVGLLLILAICRFFPISWWDSGVTYGASIFIIVLLLVTYAYGNFTLGATRRISVGPFEFQTSEFAKIVFVLATAKLLDEWFDEGIDTKSFAIKVAGFIVFPLALILVAQSDLGTTVVCAIGIWVVAWAGGFSKRFLLIAGFAVVCIGVIAVVSSPYRMSRLVNTNPWNDGQNGQGDGYQLVHSFYGFAEGGIFGVGIGSGSQKYLYLTQAESDFIFSVIGEELGMVGAVSVLLLFLVFLYAGIKISDAAPTPFMSNVAKGLTIMIVFQACMNMSCAIGLIPTTGKPLPFISYGGSSMLSSMCLVGFLLSISFSSTADTLRDRKRDNFKAQAR